MLLTVIGGLIESYLPVDNYNEIIHSLLIGFAKMMLVTAVLLAGWAFILPKWIDKRFDSFSEYSK